MPLVYRITKNPFVGELVDSTEAAESFAREHGPGRYQVDEHSLDPFPGTEISARAWGTIIHQPNGRNALKPYFFGDHYAVVLPSSPNLLG
jgi:hypothetical protein